MLTQDIAILPFKAYQTICIYIELKGLSGKHVFFLNIS